MLVLSRRTDEQIMIGDSVTITVIEIVPGKVRLGIRAPKEVAVHRSEVYDQILKAEGVVGPGTIRSSARPAVSVGGPRAVPNGPMSIARQASSAASSSPSVGRPRGGMARTARTQGPPNVRPNTQPDEASEGYRGDRSAGERGPWGLPAGLGDEAWEGGES